MESEELAFIIGDVCDVTFVDQLYDQVHQIYEEKVKSENDPHANFELGYIYQEGFGNTNQDLNKAYKYYQVAVEAGHPAALYQICQLYGLTNDYYFNVENVNELAEIVVRHYVQSAAHGIEYSPADSELWPKIAASQVWKDALIKLISSHKQTIDISDKVSTSKQRELARCYNELGYMTLRLNQVSRDKNKDHQAYQYFVKAAELGESCANYNIATLCYNDGRGVEKDEEQQLAYIKKAADAGHALAQFLVACDYDDNFVKTDNADDYKMAREYYDKSNSYGAAMTNYRLGFRYLCKGGGLHEYDPKQALHYFQLGATSWDYVNSPGVGLSFFAMGAMYKQGIGVQVNYNLAAHCFAASGKYNFYLGLIELAKLIEKEKIQVSHKKGAQLLYEHVVHIDELENRHVGHVYYRLGRICLRKNTLRSRSKAKHWFKTAYQVLHTICSNDQGKINKSSVLYHLGLMYHNGHGVKFDADAAEKYYHRAIDVAEKLNNFFDCHYAEKAKKKLHKLASRSSVDEVYSNKSNKQFGMLASAP